MLADCVDAFAPALEGLVAQWIVVDNLGEGSVGRVVDGLRTPVELIENPTPRGFAANVNLAVDRAEGRWLLLVNPDTHYLSGRVADAIRYLDQHAEVGIAGLRLLNPDYSIQQSYRRFPTVAVLAARALAADRWAWRPGFYRRAMMEDVGDGQIDVDWVFGASMLMSRALFHELGGMDERFRLYYEDVDLCYRCRTAGFRVMVLPSVTLVHQHARQSASQPLGQLWRWHLRSAVRYFVKHRYVVRPRIVLGSAMASQEGEWPSHDRS